MRTDEPPKPLLLPNPTEHDAGFDPVLMCTREDIRVPFSGDRYFQRNRAFRLVKTRAAKPGEFCILTLCSYPSYRVAPIPIGGGFTDMLKHLAFRAADV